jgi:hypothetical protein
MQLFAGRLPDRENLSKATARYLQALHTAARAESWTEGSPVGQGSFSVTNADCQQASLFLCLLGNTLQVCCFTLSCRVPQVAGGTLQHLVQPLGSSAALAHLLLQTSGALHQVVTVVVVKEPRQFQWPLLTQLGAVSGAAFSGVRVKMHIRVAQMPSPFTHRHQNSMRAGLELQGQPHGQLLAGTQLLRDCQDTVVPRLSHRTAHPALMPPARVALHRGVLAARRPPLLPPLPVSPYPPLAARVLVALLLLQTLQQQAQ